MKRVVITGLGIVSCLGNSQEEVYQYGQKEVFTIFLLQILTIKDIGLSLMEKLMKQ